MDVDAFNRAAAILLDELRDRVAKGVSAYQAPGRRVMVGGSPSPMGFAKIHYVLESAGLRIVADESCTGQRYHRDKVDETATDVDGMLEAVADRYFRIDCSCFSPNRERIDNVLQTVSDYGAVGMVHTILQYCHAYDIEAKALDKALSAVGIPSLKIVTDYSEQDEQQIRVRVEAFAELLG
jgi:benzoyl-CoA reductase/2-hydroxyglutaryl-CoA dehydratase subunit BcrC/BadD/HgdB